MEIERPAVVTRGASCHRKEEFRRLSDVGGVARGSLGNALEHGQRLRPLATIP
jgi:hypothetical protein